LPVIVVSFALILISVPSKLILVVLIVTLLSPAELVIVDIFNVLVVKSKTVDRFITIEETIIVIEDNSDFVTILATGVYGDTKKGLLLFDKKLGASKRFLVRYTSKLSLPIALIYLSLICISLYGLKKNYTTI